MDRSPREGRSAGRTAWRLAAILIAGLVSFVPFLGEPWAIGARELRHAEIGRELAQRGGIVPTLFGVTYVDKPPAYHLAMAAVFRLAGGASLALARTPSVIAALLGALAIFGIGSALADEETGLLAALLTLASVEYQHLARLAKPDMPLVAAILCSCFAALWCLRTSGARRAGAAALAGSLAAVATLIKGPIGSAVPALFVVAALAMRRDLARPRAADLALAALAAGATLAAWAIPAWRFDHGTYLMNVLSHPDLRGADDAPRPLWWYGSHVLLGALPFATLLPLVARDVRRHGWTVALITAAALLVAISLVPKKRPHYALPIYPFLALAIAEAVTRFGDRRVRVGTLAVAAAALLTYPVHLWLTSRHGADREEPKWAMAGRLLATAEPGYAIVGIDEVAEAIAFRAPSVAVSQAYDASELAAELLRKGPGTYLIAPAHEDTLLAHAGARVPLHEVSTARFANGRSWRVFRVGSAG